MGLFMQSNFNFIVLEIKMNESYLYEDPEAIPIALQPRMRSPQPKPIGRPPVAKHKTALLPSKSLTCTYRVEKTTDESLKWIRHDQSIYW